ncbi:MAG TPA: NlpC/P60 family protein [Verrucomicrobiae bacterium]|nr:NlpC/P60 family protein [Verrucomicrobiae bacterium]
MFSFVLTVFAALLLCPLPAAASQEGRRESYRLITRDEGLAIVDAISDHHRSLRGKRAKPDCSHLVNDIYDLAGFPFPYAKSADLYRGHASFVRVSAPQPGDLIVWRGHVGLVLDPQQHFFYSSLRFGLETEDYTSAYWRRRGTPRFYRYRAASDQTILTARQIAPRNDLEGNFRTQLVSQSTSDEPRTNVTSRDSLGPLPASDDDSPNSHVSNTDEIAHTAPSKTAINIGNRKPTTEQVKEAISKMYQSVSQDLNADSLLHSKSPVAIFTQLRVERLDFKGKHGWADISIDTEELLTSGKLDKLARHDEQHWEMQHAKSGWTITAPTQNIYVPRAFAVRIFAQQLAQLTGQSVTDVTVNAASEESHLASLLNTLLNK